MGGLNTSGLLESMSPKKIAKQQYEMHKNPTSAGSAAALLGMGAQHTVRESHSKDKAEKRTEEATATKVASDAKAKYDSAAERRKRRVRAKLGTGLKGILQTEGDEELKGY